MGTDYTLTAAGIDSGGTATSTTAHATGETVVITLEPPNTQDKSLPIGGPFPSRTVEDGLDIASQRDAKIQDLLNRTMQVPKTDTRSGSQLEMPNETTRANQYLVFNASGDPAVSSGSGTDTALRSDLASLVALKGYDMVGAATAMAADITTIGSSDRTLFIVDQQNIIADLTIPANVNLNFKSGGSFNISAGVTLTINGSITSAKHTIFSTTGTVVFGGSTNDNAFVDEVYPEWWGARSAASTGTATDGTAAIAAAINTGKHVTFGVGFYGHTGGFAQNQDGQKVIGAGRRWADDNGGTVLFKMSGTGTSYTLGAYGGMELGGIFFDCNGLAGNALDMASAYSATVEKLRFKNVGGTSAALYLSDINQCNLYDLYFDTGCYKHILTNSAVSFDSLYSNFYNLNLDAPTAGQYSIDIQRGTALHFYNTYCQSIRINGKSENIKFFGLNMEPAQAGAISRVLVDGTSISNIGFDTVRIRENTAGNDTENFFKFKDVRNIAIDDLYITDVLGAANRDIISLDGVQQLRINNYTMKNSAANASNMVVCTGTRSDDIKVENWEAITGTATNKWMCTRLKVENGGAIAQTFLAGTGANVVLENCSGLVTTANAPSPILINCPSYADTSGVALKIYDGKIIGPTQTLIGAGAVNLTSSMTTIDTTGGAAALTLADGVANQVKEIIMTVDAGDATLTPTNFGNGSTITLNDVGDSCRITFVASKWWLLNNNGCIIA